MGFFRKSKTVVTQTGKDFGSAASRTGKAFGKGVAEPFGKSGLTPGLTTRSRDLWEIAGRKAEHPSLWKKMRHSKFFDPYRRGVKQSIRKILGKGVQTGLSFIPIPVVKDIVTGAVDKAKSVIRGHYTASTLAEQADFEGKAKWGWKDLNVEDMDRYRWKVKHAVEVLNDAYSKAAGISNSSSVCNDWGRPAAKYHYLFRRTMKLREKAETIKQLCEDTLAWVNEVETNANAKEQDLKDHCAAVATLDETNLAHLDCDDAICVHKDKIRWVEKHQRIARGISTSTAFVVNDLGDLAPGPHLSDTYKEDTYKESP